MGCGSSSFFLTTTLVGALLSIFLLLQTSGATRLRQRGSSDLSKGGGSINEAVFALRDRQEGGRRARKTTTSTTSSTTALTTAAGLKFTATSDNVAQPAALLAPDDQTWFIASTSPPPNIPQIIRGTSRLPPLEIVVKPQAKVVLPCELGGNYSRILQTTSRSYRTRPAKWRHNDVPVDMITIDTRTEMSGTGHRYIGDSSTAALHIDSARLEDDGIWKCTIDNDHGELLSGRTVKLVILEAPRATYLLIDGRRLDPGNQFVPVKEGSELALECAAEGGNPPSALSWGMTLAQTVSTEGPEQPPDNLTVVPSTRGAGHSGAHLKVQRKHHNATIICTARHVTLTTPMNASILLDVQYSPSFTIIRFPGFGTPIFEGMPFSLKCEVDSNPSSLPIWQLDDRSPPVEQSDDGWLNFTRISREDSGWYKCCTKYLSGLLSSIGYFLAVRSNSESEMEAEALNGEAMDTRKMEVQIGGAVTLECEGGCWGHGSAMDPAGSGPLAINRVVYQDAGEYRCVAPDRKLQDTWRAHLPYQIKVTGQPMVNPPVQSVSAEEGDTLEVAVEFCAEPSYTKLLWLSSDSVYVPGGNIRDGVRVLEVEDGGTEACFKTILRIEAVQLSHAGEWMLIIRSPAGVADASVSVNVTRASDFSGNCIPKCNILVLLLCLTLITFYPHWR